MKISTMHAIAKTRAQITTLFHDRAALLRAFRGTDEVAEEALKDLIQVREDFKRKTLGEDEAQELLSTYVPKLNMVRAKACNLIAQKAAKELHRVWICVPDASYSTHAVVATFMAPKGFLQGLKDANELMPMHRTSPSTELEEAFLWMGGTDHCGVAGLRVILQKLHDQYHLIKCPLIKDETITMKDLDILKDPNIGYLAALDGFVNMPDVIPVAGTVEDISEMMSKTKAFVS